MENLLPREKMKKDGASVLTESELLAIILGRGTAKKNVFNLAQELAEFLASCSRLPALEQLLEIKGLGEAKAMQILACLELSSRFLLSGTSARITSPEKLIPFLAFLKNKPQEYFVLASLDSANHILQLHTLTKGLVNQTQIHPREAFIKAIEDHAVGVIFAHNHPSGATNPSDEDLHMTQILCDAGKLLRIPVMDHVIVSASGFYSIKRNYPNLF